MIHLIDVTKSYESDEGIRVVLESTTLSLPARKRIGVLGRNGAGKSTLLQMIAGVQFPDQGEIVRTVSVSWPLGFGGGFHGDLTGRENVVFVSRIHGIDPDEAIAFVEDFSELGPYFDLPVRTYSSGMRGRLTFGASLAVDFDCYLIDEVTAVGDRWFRDRSEVEFAKRRERSGMIMVSHSFATIREFCEIALVLHDSRLIPFDDLEDAIRFYKAT